MAGNRYRHVAAALIVCCIPLTGVLNAAREPQRSQPPTPSFERSSAEAVINTYCVSCHDSAKTGAARNGAPAFHDFDTLAGIKNVSNHVDEYAASGPASTNETMPEGDGPVPSLAERQMLGEWIACGAPP